MSAIRSLSKAEQIKKLESIVQNLKKSILTFDQTIEQYNAYGISDKDHEEIYTQINSKRELFVSYVMKLHEKIEELKKSTDEENSEIDSLIESFSSFTFGGSYKKRKTKSKKRSSKNRKRSIRKK